MSSHQTGKMLKVLLPAAIRRHRLGTAAIRRHQLPSAANSCHPPPSAAISPGRPGGDRVRRKSLVARLVGPSRGPRPTHRPSASSPHHFIILSALRLKNLLVLRQPTEPHPSRSEIDSSPSHIGP
ncbi:hypothetical protein E4U54_004834 [Claviceps lovelessii]|nr:hypothetical protein E4U54_004834 [Claviceps lovelessii]